MTDVRPRRAPLEAGEPSGLVARRGAHAPSHKRGGPGAAGPSRRWLTGFFGLLTVIVLLGVGLAYVGFSTVRSSRAGRVISTITDPEAPGFEALVEPSPTLVVLGREGERELRSVAVLSLNANDQGGSVLLVPPSTLTVTPDSKVTLSVVMAFGAKPEDARYGVQDVATMGIAETALVDAERWSDLVAPVAPLTIENPVATAAFPAGPISLEADQVYSWLHDLGDGETELDLLRRQELFWSAWADAVGASDAAAPVPGEVDSGIGRFVRGLGNGGHRVESIPVTPTTVEDVGEAYLAERDATRALVNQLVPFPTGSPRDRRVRVRVLDGTGDRDHVRSVAPMLVPADAEIVVAGNADSFDYEVSEVRWHVPEVRAAAESLKDALGAGVVVEDPRPTEAFDVTIILGSDV